MCNSSLLPLTTAVAFNRVPCTWLCTQVTWTGWLRKKKDGWKQLDITALQIVAYVGTSRRKEHSSTGR